MLARNSLNVKLPTLGSVQESKTTSKTSSLKALLLKAWRERWSDLQWGINIKTVLPRGVSGDVYDLADCILQQAVIGSGANQLVLSYLRHSLSAQLVSYSAVLQQISKCGAKQYSKPHCITSLLDFLEAIQASITCRAKPEEKSLATALLNVSHWLLNVLHYNLTNLQANTNLLNQNDLLDKPCVLLNNFIQTDFFISMLYLAKFDNPDTYADIQSKCHEIDTLLKLNTATFLSSIPMDHVLKILSNLDINVIFPDQQKPEPITYCIQCLLTIEVFCNPCSDTKNIVVQLLMFKRIKGYTMPRLYCELVRACLMSLNNVSGTPRESQWGAYTFLKVPHILQQLNNLSKTADDEKEFSQDIVDAFEMLLQYTPLLDITDLQCSCNCLEYLLNELKKLNLVTDQHFKYFASKRDGILLSLQKLDPSSTTRASIPKVIIRAEPTLAGILKTLSADYVKIQESLLSMLHQVLTGKSIELILAVATVEGKLKTFVSKLIKFNENSKQPMTMPESSKSAQSRAMLFDISFLMLCSIVQVYGSKVVLEENGDSFFEQWVRSCMVEPDVPKSPDHMLKLCDATKVDALLKQFNSSDATADFKTGQTKWHEVCLNVSGVVKELLYAWERGSIGAADVKRVLDALRGSKAPSWTGGCCSLAVCASAWLCAHVRLVHHDALLKPMNMVQQLGSCALTLQANGASMFGGQNSAVTSSTVNEDVNQHQDSYKERLSLMSQIIRKFQCYDINPPGGGTKNKLSVTVNPTSVQLRQIFTEKCLRGSIINIEATTNLQNLLHISGPKWFVNCIVKEVLKLRYLEDLNKAVDLAFSIFHLDIENCSLALLTEVLPVYLYNYSQSEKLMEPQSSTLAKLCVYCIVATIEHNNCKINNGFNSKKRSRRDLDSEDDSSSPASKLLRLNESSASEPNLTLPGNISASSGASVHTSGSHSDGGTSVSSTVGGGNGSGSNSNTFGNGATNINNIVSTSILGNNSNSNSRYGVFGMDKTASPQSECLTEPLSNALTRVYRDFLNVLARDSSISYEIYFVFQFLKACVLYGKDLANVILQNLPKDLVPNLIKCLPDLFTCDLLLKIYDLSGSRGTFMCNSNRDLVARDLCMLRNISLKKLTCGNTKSSKS